MNQPQPNESNPLELLLRIALIVVPPILGAWLFLREKMPPERPPAMTKQQAAELQKAAQEGRTGPAFRTLMGVDEPAPDAQKTP